MRVRVTLFGALRVDGPLGSIDASGFPSRKARHVFEVLALAGGDVVTKERLVDEVWGERLPVDPIGAVEQAVSVLRRALTAVSPDQIVVTRGDRYLLDPATVMVDVAEFDAAIVDASRARTEPDREEHLHRALALATGLLLSDERSSSWLDRERERRRQVTAGAWRDVAVAAAVRGDHDAAHQAAAAARHHAVDVADEVRRIEIDALAALGRLDDAHRELASFERALAEERRAPHIDLDALRSRVAVPGPRRIVATHLAPVGDLPFLGRREALEGIAGALAGEASTTVIVAPTGTGRTAVLHEAVRAARAHMDVVEVACAPGERAVPMLVAARIARGFARAAGARMPAVDDRAAALFGRVVPWIERCAPVLLAVDDVHAADDVSLAFLASLADARVGLHLVATCRVGLADLVFDALGTSGVRRVDLGPLTSDELAPVVGADQVAAVVAETGGHPATLVACAAAARRGAELDARELAAVLARVDELPALARDAVITAAAMRTPTVAVVARRLRRPRIEVADALTLARERGVVGVDGDRVDVIPAILRRCLAGRING